MTLATDIENALRPHLPTDQHVVVTALALVLADAAIGVVSPALVQARLSAPDLISTLRALAGREVTAGSTLITFGAGNDVGDVSIGDVAGRSIIKLSLSAGVVQNVRASGQARIGDVIGVQHNYTYNTNPTPAKRKQALRALLHDHSGFIASRLEAFVGREAELEEMRQRIAEKIPTGGYVTITGQAGQGKSSVIARLVADVVGDFNALQERLQQPEAGVPICHFIPFSPPQCSGRACSRRPPRAARPRGARAAARRARRCPGPAS